MSVRVLGPGDEAALEAFLVAHADSSMFLRSNLRAAGLVDRGAPLEGTYAADVDDTGGRITGVVGHFWNGNLLTQASPARVGALARAAIARTGGRAVGGIVGPWAQVVALREALGLADAPAAMESREDLFALELAALRVPASLADGTVAVRAPTAEELDLLTAWRSAYCVEALGAEPGAALDAASRGDMERLCVSGEVTVLVHAGGAVAMAAVNARLPDVVQVGGVWTPPEARGRGHARAVVAGMLQGARAAGATRAILFTGADHASAQAAYRAIGFEVVGDYGIVLLREPKPLPS